MDGAGSAPSGAAARLQRHLRQDHDDGANGDGVVADGVVDSPSDAKIGYLYGVLTRRTPEKRIIR